MICRSAGLFQRRSRRSSLVSLIARVARRPSPVARVTRVTRRSSLVSPQVRFFKFQLSVKVAVTLRVDLRFSSRLSGRPSFCFFFARSLQRCCSDRRPASPHRSKSESQRQSPRTKIAKTANILSWQCDVRERGGASRNDTTRGHEHAGPIGAGPSTARNGGLITHSAPSISFIAVYGFFRHVITKPEAHHA